MKRIFTPILSAALLLAGLLVMALPAQAQTAYVDENGVSHTSPATATALGGGHTITLDDAGANQGWYITDCGGGASITRTDTITVSGDVKLILADGCRLTVTAVLLSDDAGINVSGANRLTVYAQSTGSAMGTLTARGDRGGAGIGGGGGEDGGTITINGGTVTATGSNNSAGIGGGNGGDGGTITINGGKVTGNGSNSGAGIGGGEGSAGGVITISGGTVEANSLIGAGIGGGGYGGAGGVITINGGTVTAESGLYGAGIGSGSSTGVMPAPAGTIIISTTGTVTAIGGRGSPIVMGAGANIGQGSYDGSDGGAGIASLTNSTDASVALGGSASFTCDVTPMATAAAPTFMWNWQSLGGTPPVWSDMGETTTTLNLSPVDASMVGEYRCVASVAAGDLPNDAASSIVYASAPMSLTLLGGGGGGGGGANTVSVPALQPLVLVLLALLLAGVVMVVTTRRA